ncbi:MAG: hypothetical protein CME69_12325 [Halobacteriovorax sp.]|nr:hypothetical protein [Halobacteriovorax sp.]|tara:strand:- start:775 stop:1380 length:606 start_codon:yes stop_codon:yes gene_type:complete
MRVETRSQKKKKNNSIGSLIDFTEPVESAEIVEDFILTDEASKQFKKNEIKKKAQEKKLSNKIKSLDKKIEKTDKLIAKAKKQELKPSYSLHEPETIIAHSLHTASKTLHTKQHNISKTDYYMLNRLPKLVMKFVLEKSVEQNIKENEILFLDTFELKSYTNKSASHIANTLQNLAKKGFIDIVESKSNGMRQLRVNSALL